MKLRKKTDLPLESLTNDSTNLQPTSPTIDSPPAQEDSKHVLPTNTEVVPLITQKAPNKLKNKNNFGCLSWLVIFLGLGIGGVFLALPSLMSCTNKAKASEAKNNIGAMNRAQQAYYSEYQKFSNSMESLGIGIRPETVNYQYSIRTTETAAFNYAIARKGTGGIKSYVGGVFAIVDPNVYTNEMITIVIVCEATSSGSTQIAAPTLQEGVPTCGSDTKELGKN
jgi:type IV pilus assembly protein PilA